MKDVVDTLIDLAADARGAGFETVASDLVRAASTIATQRELVDALERGLADLGEQIDELKRHDRQNSFWFGGLRPAGSVH